MINASLKPDFENKDNCPECGYPYTGEYHASDQCIGEIYNEYLEEMGK